MKPTCVTAAIIVLEAARCRIDHDYRHYYICHALDDVAIGFLQEEAAQELIGYIQTTLENDPNYPGGMAVIGDCLPKDLNWCGSRQLCRLAWIDAMLRDLKATGELP